MRGPCPALRLGAHSDQSLRLCYGKGVGSDGAHPERSIDSRDTEGGGARSERSAKVQRSRECPECELSLLVLPEMSRPLERERYGRVCIGVGRLSSLQGRRSCTSIATRPFRIGPLHHRQRRSTDRVLPHVCFSRNGFGVNALRVVLGAGAETRHGNGLLCSRGSRL